MARHSETLEELVVYQALYGDHGLWVRPASMFQERIDNDDKMVERFEFEYSNLDKAPKVNGD